MSGNRKLSFDIDLFHDDEHISQYVLSSEIVPQITIPRLGEGGVDVNESALDHLNALNADTLDAENGSRASINEVERCLQQGYGGGGGGGGDGGRDRLDSWGAMSYLSLNATSSVEGNDLLGASAALTELANDVCNIADNLNIPSPLPSPLASPRLEPFNCPETPPLAPMSCPSNSTDINALVANAVASLNSSQLDPVSGLDMGVTAALHAQEALLATAALQAQAAFLVESSSQMKSPVQVKPAPAVATPQRPHQHLVNGPLSTPIVNNTSKRKYKATSMTSPSPGGGGKGQSNQKWEEMYTALTQYITSQTQTWEGNVPTHYKTSDGKALGRWVGNQRAAKHKGLLKPDRQKRLENTGLKWTVLSTNAWSDMMHELRLYVLDKTKNAQKWNGNVPTNYKIKSNIAPDGITEIDEEKNLGRWINRQRSLYQCGRLKKDRQRELEKIGLKWSVLSTSTWESMFDSLCTYVNTLKSNSNIQWDGNVPANFKTNDAPPKNLGRWVNRQRSAYTQNRLCKEHMDKLISIGLKLSINDNKNVSIQMNNNVAIISNNIVDVNCSSVAPAMILPQQHQQQQQHNQLTSVVTVIAPKVEHPIIARPVIPDGILSYINNESVTSNKKIKM